MKGDPVKEIIKTAFDHGINFIDTAEGMPELRRSVSGQGPDIRNPQSTPLVNLRLKC